MPKRGNDELLGLLMNQYSVVGSAANLVGKGVKAYKAGKAAEAPSPPKPPLRDVKTLAGKRDTKAIVDRQQQQRKLGKEVGYKR